MGVGVNYSRNWIFDTNDTLAGARIVIYQYLRPKNQGFCYILQWSRKHASIHGRMCCGSHLKMYDS